MKKLKWRLKFAFEMKRRAQMPIGVGLEFGKHWTLSTEWQKIHPYEAAHEECKYWGVQ